MVLSIGELKIYLRLNREFTPNTRVQRIGLSHHKPQIHMSHNYSHPHKPQLLGADLLC